MDRLGAMEMFVHVVETKSFSAAARDLKVGQLAVSTSVAQLEERSGVRLLMRSTRGLSPTEAGYTFYERARKIIDDAHEAAMAVSGERGGVCDCRGAWALFPTGRMVTARSRAFTDFVQAGPGRVSAHVPCGDVRQMDRGGAWLPAPAATPPRASVGEGQAN